ncbi:hypothetical protein CYMTET_15433 [Cymbomonas tetramitiformis]|uniref:Uncharacterized protein n=1 Tax=Cymbomonas tetramitiformis TaxID=36881 RepID=A0AAE0GE20_9CHLO|nr:hypothetical protein CYMTET_15433 [Cymbomonas tetramitiformis]
MAFPARLIGWTAAHLGAAEGKDPPRSAASSAAPESLIAIVTGVLIDNGTLLSLNISDNPLCGVYKEVGADRITGIYNPEGLKGLAEAVTINMTLTRLNMCNVITGGAESTALADAVLKNETMARYSGIPLHDLRANRLGVLQLRNKSVGQTGCIIIARALRWKGCQLHSIDLSNNNLISNICPNCGKAQGCHYGGRCFTDKTKEDRWKIDCTSMDLLCEALTNNTSLTSLKLDENKLGRGEFHNEHVPLLQQLTDAIATNKSVTLLSVQNNDIAFEGAKVMGSLLLKPGMAVDKHVEKQWRDADTVKRMLTERSFLNTALRLPRL